MGGSQFEQAILPLFEEFRGDWLAEARRIARELGKGGRHVTIDDVRTKLPPPAHLDPRVMGAVLKGKHWLCVDYRQSTRSTCHKRPIGVFVLKEEEA